MHNDLQQDMTERLFNKLDLWRNLPNYQMERRADIFFALYLLEALEARFKAPMHPVLIPEFPVPIKYIKPDKSPDIIHDKPNHSFKIDYVAFSADLSTAYLVELKTDVGSRNKGQDCNLAAAQIMGIKVLLEGVRDLSLHSTSKKKYLWLLEELEKIGLVEFNGPPSKLETVINDKLPTKIVVVYIQPCKADKVDDKLHCKPEPMEIYFEEFIETVRTHNDPISRRFSKSLESWKDTKAGKGDPTCNKSGSHVLGKDQFTEHTVLTIPQTELISGRWYAGRGRNGNIGLWNDDCFLVICTIGKKIGPGPRDWLNEWGIKQEPYYTENEGCFQPFRIVDEGQVATSIGPRGWDKHYATAMIFDQVD